MRRHFVSGDLLARGAGKDCLSLVQFSNTCPRVSAKPGPMEVFYRTLESGFSCKKHGRKGSPKMRYFMTDGQHDRLYYCKHEIDQGALKSDKPPYAYIDFSKVHNVRSGEETEVLKRHKSPSKSDKYLSLVGLAIDGGSKTSLDLEFESEERAAFFYDGFSKLFLQIEANTRVPSKNIVPVAAETEFPRIPGLPPSNTGLFAAPPSATTVALRSDESAILQTKEKEKAAHPQSFVSNAYEIPGTLISDTASQSQLPVIIEFSDDAATAGPRPEEGHSWNERVRLWSADILGEKVMEDDKSAHEARPVVDTSILRAEAEVEAGPAVAYLASVVGVNRAEYVYEKNFPHICVYLKHRIFASGLPTHMDDLPVQILFPHERGLLLTNSTNTGAMTSVSAKEYLGCTIDATTPANGSDKFVKKGEPQGSTPETKCFTEKDFEWQKTKNAIAALDFAVKNLSFNKFNSVAQEQHHGTVILEEHKIEPILGECAQDKSCLIDDVSQLSFAERVFKESETSFLEELEKLEEEERQFNNFTAATEIM